MYPSWLLPPVLVPQRLEKATASTPRQEEDRPFPGHPKIPGNAVLTWTRRSFALVAQAVV
ncbi:hypothetical protein AAY473_027093 [Plecturocebus cupreus]